MINAQTIIHFAQFILKQAHVKRTLGTQKQKEMLKNLCQETQIEGISMEKLSYTT